MSDVVFGKVKSSQIPNLHLIPTESLMRLAERFQLGIDKKGDGAWNALSLNQECLEDRKLLIDRIGHVICHALQLRDKIINGEDPLGLDDDSSAIMWGGAFFCCATKVISKNCKEEFKEIEMEEGAYFLINEITNRIFGTKCFDSEEEAINHKNELEKKWENNPKDRRKLKVQKLEFRWKDEHEVDMVFDKTTEPGCLLEFPVNPFSKWNSNPSE